MQNIRYHPEQYRYENQNGRHDSIKLIVNSIKYWLSPFCFTGLCGEDSTRCPEGMCLSGDEKCDGKVHCSDGSDEPITCGKLETEKVN